MALSTSVLTGLFKEIYADKLIDLAPQSVKLLKMVKFESKEKSLGNIYHQPVCVSDSQGFTYSAPDGNAFSLNDAVSFATQDAQVKGYQLLLRESIDYETAARASSSKSAFVEITGYMIKRMLNSMQRRLEMSFLYGNSGLAQTSGSVNIGATSTTVTFSLASFAQAMFNGMSGCYYQFYTNVPALVSSGADSIFSISKIDVEARTAVFTGTATGITALDSAIGSATCSLWFNGSYGKEMSGLDKIITNTGTLFNIDAATYEMWKGNSYSASSGQLNLAKLLAGVSKAVSRGLDEDVVCFVNPTSWANLHSDQAALRIYDSSYKPAEAVSGFEKLSYHGQNGKIDVISHSMIKQGEAFILPIKLLKRIGAQDVSFKTPGFGDEIFLQMASNAGCELRLYTNQAIFLEEPAKAVKITNIVAA